VKSDRIRGSMIRSVSLAVLWMSAWTGGATVKSTMRFTDVIKDTGITFVHSDGNSGMRYIIESMSTGVVLFDYDNDGFIDIYFPNGGALKGTRYATPPRDALYHNEGNWRFTDVTDKAGLGDTAHTLGATAGDYDNDGYLDLYLSNFGSNVLYHNNGDGTFTDVTKKAGVGTGSNWVGAGVNFLDIDGDGDLDLFAARYIDFTYEKHVPNTINGYATFVGPRVYAKMPNTLFGNNGDGTFTDISRQSGIAEHLGAGMGTVCGDFDNDGDTDIYVCNDMCEDFLFLNDGKGKFEEVGLQAGIAYNLNGDAMGSMGVACADYNNDLLPDFYVTTYQEQASILFKNLGNGLFEDVTLMAGASEGIIHNIKWGCGFADFDNDGNRDLFVANGHLQDNVELWDDRSSFHATNTLYQNLGGGKFANVSADSGDGMKVKLSSRGTGFDDLDNDGKVDIVVLNIRREPTILRNDSPNPGNWLQVELRGKANTFGIGARVTVVAGNLTQIDEVHSGHGYQSDYGKRLYFGLGKRDTIDRVEVRWMGGKTEVFRIGKVNQRIILTEGEGKS
jgi:hypothetical protein